MTALQNSAVKGALIIGIGLLAVRLATAHSLPDAVMAIGVGGFDIGCVWLVQGKAFKLDEEIAGWRKAEDANALVQAAVAERLRREEVLAGTERKIAAILDEMERRTQNSDGEAAKRRALTEAREGYMAGVMENRARSVAPKEIQ